MNGKPICDVFSAGPHTSGAHLSTKEMGWLLFSILYTVPKLGMQFYSKRDDWLQKVLFWFDLYQFDLFFCRGCEPSQDSQC